MNEAKTFTERIQRTLLVVEDDPLLSKMLSNIFNRLGLTILTAQSGLEALDILARSPVGVALLDKNLKGELTGIDVLRLIPTCASHVKVIILTAFASVESVIEALRLGAFDYIEKPFELSDLERKVSAAFKLLGEEIETGALMARHSLLFETIPGVVWFMTEQGIIRRINEAGANSLGYQPEELLGKSYTMLLAGDEAEDAATHWVFMERRTQHRSMRRRLARLRTAGGEQRIFEVYSAGAYFRMPAAEDLVGTVGLAFDVTDVVMLERELQHRQKMDALGRMAGSVAHDLSNVLTAILGFADLARQGSRPEGRVQGALDNIEKVARGAVQMVQQLLSISRKGATTPRPIDLGGFLREMTQVLQRLAGTQIELKLALSSDPWKIRIDPGQLQQIVLNLAVNARDAMPGGGQLRMETRNLSLDVQEARAWPGLPQGDYVMLTATDTGVGIAADVLEHIFEPFYTTKGPDGGTGLGLAIVYGVVRQNGGQIKVCSEEGKGTTFTLLLPRCTDQPAPEEVAAEGDK